ESSDWKHKKHKDDKWHDHHESSDWKHKKHKDHKWNHYDESSDLDHYKKTENGCVCDKVKEINKAQKKVAGKKHGCDTSCERSIKELLNHCKHSEHDTIPFKLLCGCIGECETFVGTGVVNINGCFFDIRSSFFRVVDFVKGSDCCAILELLCPERCEGNHGISGFVRTGACFEVDLNDFTGITCFPPVAAKKMDPQRLLNGGYKKKSR
ncbi:CotY/CotZ family spore coat protein, partial [Bacillus sp. ISL-39]|uniref:CotY/CotZ family spore coat protein n=1 Tax=Bacillus sp. ISL-39 TaxID=2819124 RepID=UPI001BED1112